MIKFNNYFKTALIGFLGIFAYFFLSEFKTLPFILFNIDPNIMPDWIQVIYLFFYQLLMCSVIAIIFNKKLSKDIKDIKINHKTYFKECFKYYLIGIAVMFISNLIINIFISDGIAENEQLIRDAFSNTPIYIFISSVIFAPIMEELTFRQSLKNIFPNKYLFLIMSGLIFGYLHVGSTSITDLLYIIPYGGFGVAFAYMLQKTDNILVSMGFHFMHNGILMSLQFLLLFFS